MVRRTTGIATTIGPIRHGPIRDRRPASGSTLKPNALGRCPTSGPNGRRIRLGAADHPDDRADTVDRLDTNSWRPDRPASGYPDRRTVHNGPAARPDDS
ncbi:hypothetical protein Phou_040230 [Phytohabitans houttuyneae]|uniref:Uncharacterized protein n=1 Tax=Phytohabitans houttuyneae TaxID=1076126 RepID=A0A6V8K3W3_9ACTN|nr:hypothetical protein Phou_040230 [Phytohabitans houttuyneae]